MFELLRNLEHESENEIKDSAKNEYLSIEKEIECPRCHSIMTLHREFDLPGYSCEECDFVLHMTHHQW
jgi:ribosomal protein S27AE